MLAKIWKKVLLAICIIACIFNIMSKLVSRTSLELNLKSVENGESILNIFKQKEPESDTIDGVVNQETTQEENIVSETNTETITNDAEVTTNKAEEKTTTDFVVIY